VVFGIRGEMLGPLHEGLDLLRRLGGLAVTLLNHFPSVSVTMEE
jgi:hypothetical protein